jgi:hypothetical protein
VPASAALSAEQARLEPSLVDSSCGFLLRFPACLLRNPKMHWVFAKAAMYCRSTDNRANRATSAALSALLSASERAASMVHPDLRVESTAHPDSAWVSASALDATDSPVPERAEWLEV